MRLCIALLACVMVMSVCTGCPTRCEGPDPRAVAINYELLSTVSDTTGTVRITGVVRNWGRSDFLSSEGQQSVQLYEGNTLVATQEFINLPVDGEVEVSYERLWSTLDEFRPPAYTVLLAYDPDIYIDGNENNDDCNSNNNDHVASTTAIDALFP